MDQDLNFHAWACMHSSGMFKSLKGFRCRSIFAIFFTSCELKHLNEAD